jgi:hypothetical protein
MSSKRQVEIELARIGASMVHDSGARELYHLDAPAGKVWHTDTHSITAEYHPGHESKRELWSDLLDDIRQGVQDCNGFQDQLVEQARPCERCEHDGLIETQATVCAYDVEITEVAR